MDGRLARRYVSPVQIRDARDDDWDAIWPFFREIVAAGETYAIDPEIGEDDARRGVDDRAAGAHVRRRRPRRDRPRHGARLPRSTRARVAHRLGELHGRSRDTAGAGTGRALAEHVLDWARERGFRAMQFNAVVETNEGAVALWRSLGFSVLATVPEAFAHPSRGYVGLLIMHRPL